MLHQTVADLGSKIQTSNEITNTRNTRETAELDTRKQLLSSVGTCYVLFFRMAL